jgi:Uma2 family endonuclease
MPKALVMDEEVSARLIRQRKKRGLGRHDEVWDGVYVMPSMPSLAHQKLVSDIVVVLDAVVEQEAAGNVYPGANVSDRRIRWKRNYRVPDVVVALEGSQAVACDTFFHGGPDFLVEIQSPGEDAEAKLPFYSQVHVRELLIIHRDGRKLKLYRHDGQSLIPIIPTPLEGSRWLVSEVIPLAFRRKVVKGIARTELRRTDGKPGTWTV